MQHFMHILIVSSKPHIIRNFTFRLEGAGWNNFAKSELFGLVPNSLNVLQRILELLLWNNQNTTLNRVSNPAKPEIPTSGMENWSFNQLGRISWLGKVRHVDRIYWFPGLSFGFLGALFGQFCTAPAAGARRTGHLVFAIIKRLGKSFSAAFCLSFAVVVRWRHHAFRLAGFRQLCRVLGYVKTPRIFRVWWVGFSKLTWKNKKIFKSINQQAGFFWTIVLHLLFC